MNEQQLAIAYLKRDDLLNIDMLEAIYHGEAKVLAASPGGAVIYHAGCNASMISAADEQTARDLLSVEAVQTKPVELVVAHQAGSAKMAQTAYGLSNSVPYWQAAYMDTRPLPVDGTVCEIKLLDQRQVDFVHRHYSHDVERAYLMERLGSGVLYGAFVYGELAGFIGQHAEGSIGMLEVLPRFQRQGIARALASHATNLFLARGCTPFLQIAVGNQASRDLHEKLGYKLAASPVFWVY